MKRINSINKRRGTWRLFAAGLAAGAAFLAGNAKATVITNTFDLGPSGGGTFLEGGSFTSWPLGTLPVGSVLRSVSIDATLESTTQDNWASEIMVLVEPNSGTPGDRGGILEIGPDWVADWGSTYQVFWPASADNGPGTTVSDTKTAGVDFPATIDLSNFGLWLMNAYGNPPDGGTWSGTVTVTYDVPPPYPYGLQAVAGDGQVTLSWGAFAGATSYNVKRSTTSGGSPPGTYGTEFNVPSGTTYTDTAVVNGTTYYYVVSAVTGAGETPNSPEVRATPSIVSADLSTVVGYLPQVWADGSAISTITVTLLTGDSSPVSGSTVTLVSDRGASDTISAASGPSDANGQVTFTVKSTVAGTANFTATDVTDGPAITQTASVAFTAPPPAVTTYIPGATIITNWDFTDYQNPGWTTQRTTGLTVLGMQLGSAIPVLSDHGAMVGMMRGNAPSTMSWANSGVEMTYYAPNLPPPTSGYEFLFLWNNSPRVGFGVLANGNLRGSAYTQQQNGSADSTWTVPINSFGQGLDGLHTMAIVRNGDTTIDTFLDGVNVDHRTSAAIPATPTPQYISIGWNVNGNMYMPFGTIVSGVRAFNINPLVGAVDTNLSTVVAAPASAWADGMAFSTVTVTLYDGTSTLVPGKTVTLARAGTASSTITTVTGVTGGDGKAVFTVASSTVGTDVYTATDTTDSLAIHQTAAVAFVTPTIPTINVNFDTVLRDGLVGPAGGLGATWNQQLALLGLDGGNLVDADGVSTTVGFTCDSGGVGNWGTTTLTMLNGGAFRFGGSTFTLTITNLPGGTNYDLYLPCYVNVRSGSVADIDTLNTTSSLVPKVCDNGGGNSDSADWIENQNYVILHQVVPDASGNIAVTVTKDPSGAEAELCGFQIVAAVPQVPPPAPVLDPSTGYTVAGGYPTFTFSTVAGYKYRLITSDNVAAPLSAWQGVAVGSPVPSDANGWIVATGTSMQIQDPTPTTGVAQRFYRIEAASP